MIMEPIEGVERIARERWHLNCSVCKQKVGAKVQCSKCYTAFHPLCGRVRGLRMEMLDPPAPNMPLVTLLHCHKHCTPAPGTFGVQLKCAPTPRSPWGTVRVTAPATERSGNPSRAWRLERVYLQGRGL